jgi:HlyD family secretion protein
MLTHYRRDHVGFVFQFYNRLLPFEGAGGRPLAVHSPIAGLVFKPFRESEAVVPQGEPLLEVGDPADLEVGADVLSTDAVRIPVGARVSIEHWGGGAPLAGRVRRVEPSGFTKISALGVEEQRVNVVIDLVEPAAAWKALGDGYRVEVRVVAAERADAVTLPTAALLRHDNAWAVFALDGGRARLRTVAIGLRNALEAEVTGGLAVGDEVVVHPSDVLTDGARVKRRP